MNARHSNADQIRILQLVRFCLLDKVLEEGVNAQNRGEYRVEALRGLSKVVYVQSVRVLGFKGFSVVYHES